MAFSNRFRITLASWAPSASTSTRCDASSRSAIRCASAIGRTVSMASSASSVRSIRVRRSSTVPLTSRECNWRSSTSADSARTWRSMPDRYWSGSAATPSRIASTDARSAVSGVRRSCEIDDSMKERSRSTASSRSTITSNIAAASPSSSRRCTPVRALRSPSATRIAASQIRLASRATGRAISTATIAAPSTAGTRAHINRRRSWSLMNIDCAAMAIIKNATPSTASIATRKRTPRPLSPHARAGGRSPTTALMSRTGSQLPRRW